MIRGGIKMRLILIDDDKLVRISLEKILEADGFEIARHCR